MFKNGQRSAFGVGEILVRLLLFWKMKTLIVEITKKDGSKEKHECVDFPYLGSDFITFYKENFKREHIRTEIVQEVKQYFNG